MKSKQIDYYGAFGGNGENCVVGLINYVFLKWNEEKPLISFVEMDGL